MTETAAATAAQPAKATEASAPASAATPAPLGGQPAVTVSTAADSGEGAGRASKSSPGLSPSTWKPNAAAAEWTPRLGSAPVTPTPAPPTATATAAQPAGEGEGAAAVETKQDVDVATPSEAEAKATTAQPSTANGGDCGGDGGGTKDGDKGTEKATASGAPEGGASDEQKGPRYEIAFLLKLRPKPEGTPKPEGLNPPSRVDILWDGKEPAPLKAGSMRAGGIRPLPPLGGRMGSSRGLGEARGAPPPLRGAQRDMGRDRDNRMDQRGGRDDRRSGGGGGRDSRVGGGGRRPSIDTAPALEDCKPIEINEATRWKPKSLDAKIKGGGEDDGSGKLSTEQVLMKANAILNKMTLEKFNKLSLSFMDVGLRDPEVVTGVIDMIVDKAQMEPHFSSMYADLCERIARTPIPGLGEAAVGKDSSKGSRKFRKMLLLKVQEEFEKDWQGLFAAVQNDSNLADDEKEEKEFGLKKKYTGHMRFVGELYKVELLKERHVHAAIHDMFGNADEPDEERLECMVKLLQTCGNKLDQTGSPDTVKDMKRLFKRIGKVSDGRQVSSRIRFMLRDLIELRKNHWVPRREEEKAKTMQELHNDIAKEEESKNRASGRGGSSRQVGSSSSSSIRPGSGDARVSGGSRGESTSTGSRPTGLAVATKAKDDDGWETVPKKGGGGKGGGGGDGWSQVSSGSRSRPGSDERRGSSSANGGSLVAQQSAFALLSSHDDDKEKKKKKKDSKKEKSSKSGKEKKKKDKSSSTSTSTSTSKKSATASGATAVSATADVPPPAPAAAAMNEETAQKKGKDVVAEFVVSGELGEACTCLKEIDAEVRWAAVSGALSDSFERKQKHRDALAVVLAAGAKDGALDEAALLKAFEDVLDTVPDVCIDVPQAAQYVATALAPLVLGGHIALGPLLASPCEGLMEGGKAAEFAVVAIKQVKEAAVADGLSAEAAAARASDLLAGALDLPKLAAMLPFICRGDEAKAKALLERHGTTGGLKRVALGTLLLLSGAQGQTQRLCEGELGEVGWDCPTLSPIPAQVFDGQDQLLPLPGTTDPLNPVLYRQISGSPMFDETGERSDVGGAAVYTLTAGAFWCMLAESNGEAALFDAPEGGFVSSALEFPTGTWLSESIEAILAPGTKLKYIVYSHSHWDHVGAAGFVHDYFAQDNPTIIASKRTRAELNTRDKRDPTSVHGNNRGVPIPEKLEAADYREIQVGNLRFEVQKIHANERGDLSVFLDKTIPQNAAEGIDSSIFMVIDSIFPGWIPFAGVAVANDIGGYYAAMDEILAYDFDVLVAGHLSRLGTKADVQLNKDFFEDVLQGVRSGLATVSTDDIAAGTGVFDPTNPNTGNTWLFFNELLDRQAEVCMAYVLDVAARGRDWLAELAGVEPMLKSQCYSVNIYVRVG
eukprot:g12110.t1